MNGGEFEDFNIVSNKAPRHGRRTMPQQKKRVTDKDVSPETRQLLKQMMKSSKLTFSQQRYLDVLVEESGCLPILRSKSESANLDLYKDAKRAAVSAERTKWFHNPPSRRTIQTIKESGDYDVAVYRTVPKKDMSLEKEMLQMKMQGVACDDFDDKLSSVASMSTKRNKFVMTPVELDEIEMLKEEISDRRQWMADMQTLGRADAYKKQIQSEIRLVTYIIMPHSNAIISSIHHGIEAIEIRCFTKMKILFALDFDFTTIDEDSDHFIVKTLAPELMEKAREMFESGVQWTDICNWSVGELHNRGFSPEDLNCALRKIPFNPVMAECLELMHRKGHDVLIISDANTVYIDEISKEKGIHAFIGNVITNQAAYDSEGRLHITRFIPKDSSDKHDCSKCPPNLCKGRELERFIQSKRSLTLYYDRIVYIGDGGNDFCPSSKLAPSDIAMPRKGFKFWEMLQKAENRNLIKAEIAPWETAADILKVISGFV